MKHFKSVLAMLLALVMVLSCVGTAFAADKKISTKTEISSITKNTEEAKADRKGFKSESFMELNTYRYADNEIVRAIVILEGQAEAEIGEAGSTKAATQRVKLVNQHNTVRKAMTGINYELKYDFTRLINGFSCDVAYGDLEAIAAIDGVKAVYIANSYAEPVLESVPETKQANANQVTQNSSMHGHPWDGFGVVVAVLDTGLAVDHEAFQDAHGFAALYGTLTEEDVAAADLNVDGKYISGKIPFAYDYAEGDDDVTDYNGHGTHVSGIAVGQAYTVTEDGVSINATFLGAAPCAQLVSMKIFKDAGGGTSSDIYFYALEDAYELGVDVINMSIGAQNGFTYDASLETEVFGNIYERLNEAGIILSVAAGNEYSMAYKTSSYAGYLGSEYTDYGTVASPSTYTGNVSVASVENIAYPDYVIDINGNKMTYVDSCDDGEHGWLDNFADQELEYVMVLTAEETFSLGLPEDYANVDVTGKIAVVWRGEISFEEKVEYAYNAGAIGCIVVNNQAGIISMSIETFEIPAISLQDSALTVLTRIGTLKSPSAKEYVDNPSALQMSDFSNWGTSPMLTLDPSITSVGGMVYSSVPGGTDTYDVYSGTSMAAPNMSGTFANLLSGIYDYHQKNGIEMSKAEVAELARDLMHSSAVLLKDDEDTLFSPRKQGAGLGNGYDAMWIYMESGYITNPLQELGDDAEKTGVYNMSLEIKNDSTYELYYKDFETYVLFDGLITDGKGNYYNTLTPMYAYDGSGDSPYADVTYTVNGEEVSELTLAVGESVTVDVTITLTDDLKGFFDTAYPNGTFVEGYVVFNEYVEGKSWSSIHGTFLAYYGDWTQADVLESADFMDIVEVDYFLNNTVVDAEGNTYADYGYSWSNSGLVRYYTNPNIAYLTDAAITTAYAYAGDNMLAAAPYNPEHIAFSTPLFDGTYNYAETIYMEPYLLRNASHLIMTVADKETGEIYYVDDTEYLPKSMYKTEYGRWLPTGTFAWDGTNAEGQYVPSGTVATITYDAVLPYGDAEQKAVWSFDVTVDYTAPVIEEAVFDEEAQTLTVTASDENYLQGIYLADSSYQILDRVVFSSDEKGASFTATFDVSEIIASGTGAVYVTAIDYATNENEVKTYLFGFGKDATISLVTPFGTEEVPALTGDYYFIPAAPEFACADFLFWTTEPVEMADDTNVWDEGGLWYFEGDEILISGDIVLYALYGVGDMVYYETPNFYYTQDANYNGTYALVGWPYDKEDGYVITQPQALSNSLSVVDVAALDDSYVDDYTIEFYTGNTDICFTLTENEDGHYIIRDSYSRFLSLVDGQLMLVDGCTEESEWYVFTNLTGNGTLIFNVADEGKVLLYNDEVGEFQIMDDTQPMAWALELGAEIYPSEYYELFTYKRVDSAVDVVNYTSYPCIHENTETIDAKEATCTEGGYTGDVWCLDCQRHISNGVETYALEHSKTEIRDAKEATCTEDGYTGDIWCLLCEELLVPGEAIPASGHNYVDGVCTNCGEEDPDYSKPCYYNDFSDCTAAWYHEGVDFMVANGLMKGMGGDKFEPNTALSRAMVVTVLYRVAGEPEVSEPSTFADVKDGLWYSDAIAWAQDNGIVNGVTATTFAPDQDVTREQIATILWRFAGSPMVNNADLSMFDDADSVSPYAETAIHWAVVKAIMNGDGKSLRPQDSATRAEFACMIMRYLHGSYDCNE